MAKGKAKKRLARAAKEVKASKAAPDEEAGGGHAAATSFAAKAKGASVADSQTQQGDGTETVVDLRQTVVGLNNLGNTCFFNSVLQCLVSLDPVRDAYAVAAKELPQKTMLQMGLRVCLSSLQKSQGMSQSPKGVFNALVDRAPQFKGRQQHDSHELLRVLLDGLETEQRDEQKACMREQAKAVRSSAKEEALAQLIDTPVTTPQQKERQKAAIAALQAKGREEDSAIPAEPVWVERTFRGEFRWRTTCQTCSSVSIVTEPFYDLSLPIPPPTPPPSAASASQSGAVAGAPASEEDDSGKRMSKGQKKEKVKSERRAAVKRMEEEAAEEAAAVAAVAEATVAEDAGGGKPTVEGAIGNEDGTRNASSCEGATGSRAEEEDRNSNGAEPPDDDEQRSADELEVHHWTSQAEQQQGRVDTLNSFSFLSDDATPVVGPLGMASDVGDAEDSLTGRMRGLTVEEAPGAAAVFSGAEVEEEEEKRNAATHGGEGGVNSTALREALGDIMLRPSSGSGGGGGGGATGAEEEAEEEASLSVLTCLQEFSVPEELTGDCAYECDECTRRAVKAWEQRFGEAARATKAAAAMPSAWDKAAGSAATATTAAGAREEPAADMEGDIEVTGAEAASPQQVEEQEEIPEPKPKAVHRDAVRTVEVSEAPPVLTVHLKRFQQNMRGRFSKISTHVRFERTLTVAVASPIPPAAAPGVANKKTNKKASKAAAPQVSPPIMITYDLVGVVNHLGTMNGGHYVAYVRRGTAPPGGGDQWEDEKWFYASDRTVRQVPFDEVTKCVAYMLFYTRRGGDGAVKAAAAASV